MPPLAMCSASVYSRCLRPPPPPHRHPTLQEYRSEQTAAARGQRAALQADDGDEPTCRICHGTDNDPHGDARLFSPCRCRGSVRFVHVGCLNRWRALSANPRSYFQCDACRFQYRIQRTCWAALCQVSTRAPCSRARPARADRGARRGSRTGCTRWRPRRRARRRRCSSASPRASPPRNSTPLPPPSLPY